MRVGWGATLSGVLAWVEVYSPHIDSCFRYFDASNPHLVSPNLVNLSVPYEGLQSGALKPIIDRTFTLDDIADAHRYMESNQQKGKIVVTV